MSSPPRIVGFGVESAGIDGVSVWGMFNRARADESLAQDASTDHDPLFRIRRSLDGATPAQRAGASSPARASLDRHSWRRHCRDLFKIPTP